MPEQATRNPDLIEKLGTAWCVLMHDSPMWPIHRNYQCRSCGRRYPIPWVSEAKDNFQMAQSVRPGIPRSVHISNVGLVD